MKNSVAEYFCDHGEEVVPQLIENLPISPISIPVMLSTLLSIIGKDKHLRQRWVTKTYWSLSFPLLLNQDLFSPSTLDSFPELVSLMSFSSTGINWKIGAVIPKKGPMTFSRYSLICSSSMPRYFDLFYSLFQRMYNSLMSVLPFLQFMNQVIKDPTHFAFRAVFKFYLKILVMKMPLMSKVCDSTLWELGH